MSPLNKSDIFDLALLTGIQAAAFPKWSITMISKVFPHSRISQRFLLMLILSIHPSWLCSTHAMGLRFKILGDRNEMISKPKALAEGTPAPYSGRLGGAAPGDILYEGAEVIQVIQDLSNSVPLVANKPTLVRIYLGIESEHDLGVRGMLTIKKKVEGGAGNPDEFLQVAEVPSKRAVFVQPHLNTNTQFKREDLNESLNFDLPAEALQKGIYKFSLKVVKASTGAEVPCPSCVQLEQRNPPFELIEVKPFKVVLVGIRYGAKEQSTDNAFTVSPTDRDFRMIESWLKRAFPVSTTPDKFSVRHKTTLPSDTWLSLPFDCRLVNMKVSTLRLKDIDNRYADKETRYIGVIADGGSTINNNGFMQGCAMDAPVPDPTAVASLPTGSSPVRQKDIDWDLDGVYGDWYAGHEIAHTFGRRHPGKCGELGRDDGLETPEIGGKDNAFIGYDMGEQSLDILPKLLLGSKNSDLMTYCGNNWPSAYTYRAIFDAMRMPEQVASVAPPPAAAAASTDTSPAQPSPLAPTSSTPLPSQPEIVPTPTPSAITSVLQPSIAAAVSMTSSANSPSPSTGKAVPTTPVIMPAVQKNSVKDKFLTIIALINLTKRTGKLQQPTPLSNVDEKLQGDVASRLSTFPQAKVRLKNKAGAVIGEFDFPVILSSPMPGSEQFGYVNGAVPFRPDIRALELILIGNEQGDSSTETLIESIMVSEDVPRVQNVNLTFGTKPCNLFHVEWDNKQREYKDEISYNVDMSTDGEKTWSALVTDHKNRSLCFAPTLKSSDEEIIVRVVPKNGVNNTEKISDPFKLSKLSAEQRALLFQSNSP